MRAGGQSRRGDRGGDERSPARYRPTDSTAPKYSNDVATYIDDFAHREQNQATSGLDSCAEGRRSWRNTRRASLRIWKSIYADYEAGQQAYRAGQVYVAYRLFSRANASMNGVNALTGQNRANFDVKTALAESDDLRNRLHALMNPPAIDTGELQSAVLVAEMADWAYDIDAALEGAQLVTKQTFSQRSDATDAEKDRAREAILFANEQGKYLLSQANFYNGLLAHMWEPGQPDSGGRERGAPASAIDSGPTGDGTDFHRWHSSAGK